MGSKFSLPPDARARQRMLDEEKQTSSPGPAGDASKPSSTQGIGVAEASPEDSQGGSPEDRG